MADGQKGINISQGFTGSFDDAFDKDRRQSTLAGALANIPVERRYDGKTIFVLEPANRGLYFMNITKDGFVKADSVAQSNLTAITPPAVGNDITEGYDVGSLWLDTVANEYYRCSDATFGAAVWPKTTLTADELSTVAVSGDYNDLINKPSSLGWSLDSVSTLNYPATGAASFIAVDGITNAIDITGQATTETYDFITQNVLDTGRLSSGEANFLRFQNDGVDTFKVGIDGTLSAAPDTDATTILGRTRLHSIGGDIAYFSHHDMSANSQYAIRQEATGRTAINSGAGKSLYLSIANSVQWYIDPTGNLVSQTGKNLYLRDTTKIQIEGIDTIGFDASQNVSIPNGGLILYNKADPDPTAVNGMLYYNSTTHKFRGVQNGVWLDVIGGGDVTKVGTPLNNQIGVWTGDGTIEGNTGLIYTANGLEVVSTSAATNYVVPSLSLYSRTSAVSDAGFGTGIKFYIENSGGADSLLSRLYIEQGNNATSPYGIFKLDISRGASIGTLLEINGASAQFLFGSISVATPEFTVVSSVVDASLLITPKGAGVIKVPAGYEANVSADVDLVNKKWVVDNISGGAPTDLISFYGGSPVAQAAALTAVDATVIDATYGAVEEAVINNMRTRINELETIIANLGLSA